MIPAPLLSMFVIPVAYLLLRQPRSARREKPILQSTSRQAL